MNNFNLAAALRQHREGEGASLEEMAGKLNMSRSAYYRLESDIVKPTYVKAQEIMKLLNIEEPATGGAANLPAARKWYRSKKWRWIFPILISYIFFGILSETVAFRDVYSELELETHPPDNIMILFIAGFCAIYYYYWPPEWPFKKSGK